MSDNSVGLAFISSPYNVGKDYEDDVNLQTYLTLSKNVGQKVYRVLRLGGRFVINIAILGRQPYIPLPMFFYTIPLEIGCLPMGKSFGTSGSCAWGSWLSAKGPRPRDVHEDCALMERRIAGVMSEKGHLISRFTHHAIPTSSLYPSIEQRTFSLNRLPSHYRLVKRSSHYDLMPRSRKGNSFWLFITAVLIGIFCFGPNAIVVTRILQGLYRASPLALEALSSIIHLK